MIARELKEKSVDELQAELIELRKEQFNLRMQRATAQTEHSHTLKNVRRDIARVKTVLNQKAQANTADKAVVEGQAISEGVG